MLFITMIFLFLISFILNTSLAFLYEIQQNETFHGDELVSIKINNFQELEIFWKLQKNFNEQISLWSPVFEKNSITNFPLWLDLHLKKSFVSIIKEKFSFFKISYHVKVKNFGENIEKFTKENLKNKNIKKRDILTRPLAKMNSYYANFTEIEQWLEELEKSFPKLVELSIIGKTFENRNLYVVKIRKKLNLSSIIWVDGGIHAREWIAVSSAVHIISQLIGLLENPELNKKLHELISRYEWNVSPVLNPDGYEFSFSSPNARMWRKNRSQSKKSFSDRYKMWCHGADLNRNFPFMWGGVGSSKDPCEETYQGETSESENETKALISYWLKIKNKMKVWFTLHSYGQLLMNRWAYKLINNTQEYSETLEIISKASQAIKNYSGASYRVGSSPEILYSFTGGSGDWVRHNIKMKHVYDIELRDTGNFGFILPTHFINPVGTEIWQGIQSVIMDISARKITKKPFCHHERECFFYKKKSRKSYLHCKDKKCEKLTCPPKHIWNWELKKCVYSYIF